MKGKDRGKGCRDRMHALTGCRDRMQVQAAGTGYMQKYTDIGYKDRILR